MSAPVPNTSQGTPNSSPVIADTTATADSVPAQLEASTEQPIPNPPPLPPAQPASEGVPFWGVVLIALAALGLGLWWAHRSKRT